MLHQILIKNLVDKYGRDGSYIAQSRAVFKIIYAHPPDIPEDMFKNTDFGKENLVGDLLIQIPVHNFVPSPLERILIWHQKLHFGKDPMDEKKIFELIKDYRDRLLLPFRVKFKLNCVLFSKFP